VPESRHILPLEEFEQQQFETYIRERKLDPQVILESQDPAMKELVQQARRFASNQLATAESRHQLLRRIHG